MYCKPHWAFIAAMLGLPLQVKVVLAALVAYLAAIGCAPI
jgi:hypothetical protein